jgi:hypothetical protein
MLAICRSKLAAEPEAVRARAALVEADMRQFEPGRQFALVTTPFRSFQRLPTVEDQLACLGAARRCLLPSGRLILDLFNPDLTLLAGQEYPRESAPEPAVTLPDSRRGGFGRRHPTPAHDRVRQLLDVELAYDVTYPDGRVEQVSQRFQTRYLFRYEAEHLLARAGFRVKAAYADYDGSLFGTIDPGEIILVAGLA